MSHTFFSAVVLINLKTSKTFTAMSQSQETEGQLIIVIRDCCMSTALRCNFVRPDADDERRSNKQEASCCCWSFIWGWCSCKSPKRWQSLHLEAKGVGGWNNTRVSQGKHPRFNPDPKLVLLETFHSLFCLCFKHYKQVDNGLPLKATWLRLGKHYGLH